MSTFLPGRDALLLAWSANFLAQISSSPTSVGLTAAQATNYGTAHDLFATSLATATDPSTRTRGTIAAKDASRKALKVLAREYARIANAFPGITNTQRLDLGLTPRKGTVTPINPPTESPVLEIVAAQGRTLKVRLHAIGSERASKPAGVKGASLFSFVGATPPADLSLWKFEGSSTRTRVDVVIDSATPAGSQVLLTAFWFNPRSQSGPACTPVSAYIAGGVSLVA